MLFSSAYTPTDTHRLINILQVHTRTYYARSSTIHCSIAMWECVAGTVVVVADRWCITLLFRRLWLTDHTNTTTINFCYVRSPYIPISIFITRDWIRRSLWVYAQYCCCHRASLDMVYHTIRTRYQVCRFDFLSIRFLRRRRDLVRGRWDLYIHILYNFELDVQSLRTDTSIRVR